MLTDFYIAFAAICFTLLGLWIIVVQTRHADWRGQPLYRRRAYGVALHFSVPGLMGLLSLVDPDSTTLWRVSFAIAAVAGAAVLILVWGPAPTSLGLMCYIAAVVLYIAIAIVAVAPGVVAAVGIEARPARVEAVLLTLLVFLGVNVAWLLLFDETSSTVHSRPAAGASTDTTSSAALRRPWTNRARESEATSGDDPRIRRSEGHRPAGG